MEPIENPDIIIIDDSDDMDETDQEEMPAIMELFFGKNNVGIGDMHEFITNTEKKSEDMAIEGLLKLNTHSCTEEAKESERWEIPVERDEMENYNKFVSMLEEYHEPSYNVLFNFELSDILYDGEEIMDIDFNKFFYL